jgi:hypothetical protein
MIRVSAVTVHESRRSLKVELNSCIFRSGCESRRRKRCLSCGYMTLPPSIASLIDRSDKMPGEFPHAHSHMPARVSRFCSAPTAIIHDRCAILPRGRRPERGGPHRHRSGLGYPRFSRSAPAP